MYNVNLKTPLPILLQPKHIPLFLDLQAKVRKKLHDDNKHFLKPRTAHDLKEHMGTPMPAIGIKCNKMLVAQALLSFPEHGDAVQHLEGYPIDPAAINSTAILQSLCVIPEMRGQGLDQSVLRTVFEIATMSGHQFILAKAAQTNKSSKKSLEDAGFSVVSEGLDPHEHYPVYYFKHVCGAASTTLALQPEMA